MKVEINVDEVQFKDVLDKEFKDLPKEVLQDVIVQSIKEYFEQNNYANVQNLFLYETKGYNSWDTKVTSTEFLNGLLKDCDYSGLQDVVDEAIKSVRENHKEILQNIVSGIITRGLLQDHYFKYELENVIREVIYREKSNER